MELVVSDLYQLDLGGVNAFLWTGQGGPSLFDTGYPSSYQKIEANLRSLGLDVRDIVRIYITHADIDHVGDLKRLQATSHAPVYCHTAEATYVTGAETKKASPNLPGYLMHPAILVAGRLLKPGTDHVDVLLLENDNISEGFRVLHMPGHAPGQIAFYHEERGLLILGDALTNRGGSLHLPPSVFTPDRDAAIESLGILRKLKYETACFGHGPPIVAGADRAVTAYYESLM